MFELSGKTVLITGGGGGIGGGMARAFADRGAKVALADIDVKFAHEEAAKLTPKAQAQVFALDVRSIENWQDVRRSVEERFGQIDVLCNNAGISTGFKPLLELSSEEFEDRRCLLLAGGEPSSTTRGAVRLSEHAKSDGDTAGDEHVDGENEGGGRRLTLGAIATLWSPKPKVHQHAWQSLLAQRS